MAALRTVLSFLLMSIMTLLVILSNSYTVFSAEMTGKLHALKTNMPVLPSGQSIEVDMTETPDFHCLRLSFVGDCMLASMLGASGANTFNALADSVPPEYFFAGVSEIFQNDDFTIANCENVFTDSELAPVYKDHDPAYWYRSKMKNADIFAAGSVEIVSIANNHIEDYGERGRLDTIAALDAAGVIWGDTGNPVVIEAYGIQIGLFCTNMSRAGYIDPAFRWLESNEMDYQIIYYHGGTERVYTPDSGRVASSRALVDAGADLVIGHHPHVLQPIEHYNGATILYSIGNFLFGGSPYPENRTMIYQLTLYIENGCILPELTEEKVIPCYCYTESWQPGIITDSDEIEQVMAFLHGSTDRPL